MKQKVKNIMVALTIALTGSMMLSPAMVSAGFKDDACEGVNTLNGTTGSSCDPDAPKAVDKLIHNIIQILSVIVGIAAVIMIIVSGLRLITANGDSGAIASARSGIIYSIIGLIVVAISQILVHYVLHGVR